MSCAWRRLTLSIADVPTRDRNFLHSQAVSCPLCKQAGRASYKHFLSKCSFLPDADRKFMARARLIGSLDLEDEGRRGM